MWPYMLLLGLSLWMAITHMKPQLVAGNKKRLNLTWVTTFGLLVLMIGLRHEVGGDWFNYLEHVESLQGEALLADETTRKDPLYWLLNWLGANVGGGVYFVNLVCAAIFSWGLIAFCRAQPRPWLALLVAAPYLIIVVAMGYTRQGVAIGLAMLAITHLMNGRLLRFIAWITVAALFHKSAVLLIPLSLFAGTNNRALTVVGVAISTAILFALILQEQVDGLIRNYVEAEMESSGAAVRIAMNALPAALFLIFKRRFKLDPKSRGFWIWMAWSALLFLPLLVISPSSTAIDRVALYWIPLQLLVWSRLPDALGEDNKRNPLWVYLIALYCAATLIVWLFFASHSLAWLPYRFYPWEALWI
jgi:hypothetical protein